MTQLTQTLRYPGGRCFLFVFVAIVSVVGISEVVTREASEAFSAPTTNLQTTPILQAPLSSQPLTAHGGGDITIVGDRALLAESGPSGVVADVGTPPPSGHISVYVVREGDTLSQIADMFNVSVNTIRWANDVTSNDAIRPGQTLTILPISGVRHEVESGDTLKSIAKEYDGNLEEILTYNGLAVDASLTVGDVVIIPDGEVSVPVTAPSSVPQASPRHVASGPSYAGFYMRPVQGGQKTQGLHGYNGVDIGTHAGASIFAAADGEVIISKNAGWNGGYGKYIVVRHNNGTQTLYAHNSQNIVYVGQRVVQGQVIGYVGSTGRSTGPHVHFEIRGATNPF